MHLLRVVTLGSQRGQYGGPWNTAMAQARMAARDGHQVCLFSGILAGDRPAGVESRHVAIPVRRWAPTPRHSGLFSVSMFVHSIREVFWADTVHVSLGRELISLWFTVLTIVFRRRLIIQTHGMIMPDDRRVSKLADILIRLAARQSDACIALTGREERSLVLQGFPPTKIHIVGNFAPAQAFEAALPCEPNREALFLARLHSSKRVIDFVKASELSSSRHEAIRYSVVGPDDGDLQAVRSSPTINYEGPIAPPDVVERVKQCGVFVLCSESEPWGNVLVAALALGRPVIVSRSSTLGEEVHASGAGLLVDDQDVNAIAAGVAELLGNDVLWRRMSRAARNLAEDRYSELALGPCLSSLYGSRVEQRRGLL